MISLTFPLQNPLRKLLRCQVAKVPSDAMFCRAIDQLVDVLPQILLPQSLNPIEIASPLSSLEGIRWKKSSGSSSESSEDDSSEDDSSEGGSSFTRRPRAGLAAGAARATPAAGLARPRLGGMTSHPHPGAWVTVEPLGAIFTHLCSRRWAPRSTKSTAPPCRATT